MNKKVFFLMTAAVIILMAAFVSCKKDKTVLATGVTLDLTSVIMAPIDAPLTLVATVEPAGATNPTVKWESSNPAAATVVGAGVVTAVAPGQTTIAATTTDDSNKTATCTVTVDLLGNVTFASEQTWTVGTQTWSDAVVASGANKTDYNGGTHAAPRADFRNNPGQKGSLFSWPAVNIYKARLCPAPWRVPTRQDFIDLDRTLGGTGNNGQNNAALRDAYRNIWGATNSGYCVDKLYAQGSEAEYWSQTESTAEFAYFLELRSSIFPQSAYYKDFGQSVRCVK